MAFDFGRHCRRPRAIRLTERIITVTCAIAMLAACVVIGSSANPRTAHAADTSTSNPDPFYAKGDYRIANILSEFEVFSQSDFADNTHVVGAFATGGTFTSKQDGGVTGGNASVTKSYMANLEKDSLTDWGNCDYLTKAGLTSYQGCPFRQIFYKTGSDAAINATYPDKTKKYVQYTPVGSEPDFDAIFTQIRNESSGYASSEQSYTATQVGDPDHPYDGKPVMVDLDAALANPKNGVVSISVPYSLLSQGKGIKFVTKKLTSTQVLHLLANTHAADGTDTASTPIIVNITGAEGKTVNLDFGTQNSYQTDTYGIALQATDTTSAQGDAFGSMLKKLATEESASKTKAGSGVWYDDGQFYGRGMTLMWNLPDAASVQASTYTGHIVAPNAALELKGGEGGGIGKTVTATNEIHFYPYRAVPSKPYDSFEKVTESKTGSIEWKKTDASDHSALGGSMWTLTRYTDATYATQDTSFTARSITDNGDDDGDTAVGALKVTNLQPGSYELQESAAPAGYNLDSGHYRFTIADDGTTSALKEANASVALTDNTIEDTRKTGAATWTKTDAATGSAIGGAVWSLTWTSDADGAASVNYTVTDATSDAEVTACTASSNTLCDTNSSPGVVSISSLAWGSYTLSESTPPDGYIRTDEQKTFIIGRATTGSEIDTTTLETTRDLGSISNRALQRIAPKTGAFTGFVAFAVAMILALSALDLLSNDRRSIRPSHARR